MGAFTSRYWSRAANRRISRRAALRGAALASGGVAAAALIGCGEDVEPASEGTEAPAGGAATSTAAGGETAADVKTGGRLALEQGGEPPTFDLHGSSTTYTNYVASMAYNQLLRFDPAITEESPETVIGDLASEWEISPDGQTYTFHLASGVTFHDGTPFKAADAKASYERQMDPPPELVNPPRAGNLAPIASIETPDDQTLVMSMSRPVSSLSMLPILAQGWMAIYSQKDIEGGFDFQADQNGTGPYVFTAYEAGTRVSHDKYPDYWVEGQPYLDGVDVYIVPDVSSQLANFQAGELHVWGPDLESLATLEGTLGGQIHTVETNGLGFPTMNYGNREPWTDVRVRQAVSMAHDKQAAVDVLALGEGRPGGYMPGGGYWSISEEELGGVPGYEPFTDATVAEARKLLDAAGVPNPMSGTILTRQGSSYENLSVYVQDQLSKVGINVELDIQETASAYDVLNRRDFDLAPWSHGIALDDPDAVFSEFYITGGPRNYSQISSPEVDELFLTQSQELDPERRQELVKDLQKTAMPLMSKTIFYWSNSRATMWNYVKDYVPHISSYNHTRWQEVWLDV